MCVSVSVGVLASTVDLGIKETSVYLKEKEKNPTSSREEWHIVMMLTQV